MASRAFWLLRYSRYLADTESLASTTVKEAMVFKRFFVEVMAFEAAFFIVSAAVKAETTARETSASKASAATKTTVTTKASMPSEASLFDRTASYLRCCSCCD